MAPDAIKDACRLQSKHNLSPSLSSAHTHTHSHVNWGLGSLAFKRLWHHAYMSQIESGVLSKVMDVYTKTVLFLLLWAFYMKLKLCFAV